MQAPKDWGGLAASSASSGKGKENAEKEEEEEEGHAATRRSWSCEPLPMALVDPTPACQRSLRLLGGGGEVREEGASGGVHQKSTLLLWEGAVGIKTVGSRTLSRNLYP